VLIESKRPEKSTFEPMNILTPYALDNCSLSTEDHILVAISGGQDSMVLAFALVAYGFKTTWAHCNFGLRGEESNRDENFVREEAKKRGIELHVRTFSKEDFTHTGSNNTQAAARQLRYAWFEELRQEINAKVICVAHHADDQVETIFMNFVRGTGLSGLSGMAWRNENIARPLLQVHKQSIEKYALENDIEHVEDSSNSSTKYKRNAFRHSVLPLLKSMNPNLVEVVLKEQVLFEEHTHISEEYILRTLPSIVDQQGQFTTIDLIKLKESIAPNVLIWSILKPLGFSSSQVGEFNKLLTRQTGKSISSESHTITVDRDKLIVSRIEQTPTLDLLFETLSDLEKHPAFETTVSKEIPADFSNQAIGIFDLATVHFPLTLRTWKSGDRFIPMGMSQSKKVSDFLTQEKVNSVLKPQIQVLVSDENIIWVLGQRISNLVKIKTETTDFLHIKIK
jgi:tRNA(Ile)-lysidine synthase